MPEENNHLKLKEYEEAHKRIANKTDNGACLNGRCYANYETHSCSYRYQGIEAGKGHLDIYNANDIPDVYHLSPSKCRPYSVIIAAISKKGERREISVSGLHYGIKGSREYKLKPPTRKSDGKVYSDYENDDYVIRKKLSFVNFTISKVPWPNQVHHVLNHSSLFKVIQQFTNILDVVCVGLLKELYNINDKDNMVILPTTKHFARLVGLPMHGGHRSYCDKILSEVQTALSGYDQLNADAGKPGHKKPDPIAVKQELINISSDWYSKILDVGKKNKKVKGDILKVNDIR